MSHILLLGAGFSRNWGGWLASEAFEYLLGCPQISTNPYLLELLWRNQPTGGFENALAEVQADFIRDHRSSKNNLQDIQSAVTKMFEDMNSGYFKAVDFEFQYEPEKMVSTFLTRFDAIFTLNQDILLEHYYVDHGNIYNRSSGKWSEAELPGMKPIFNSDPATQNLWARRKWMPVHQEEFRLDSRCQPYFKLHGSSNWQEAHGAPMLILGGNKILEIGLSPVLSWYHQQFEGRLYKPDTRLMVIGYGFRDAHINEVIMRSVNDYGAKMFLIAPEGGELARTVNSTHHASVRAGTELEATFKRGLIGASRRLLREIFGGDSIEHNKVLRFFEH